MQSIEECVVTAMDGSDPEIFSYLPYILQDLWEIGSSPEIVIGLVKKHTREYSQLKVLDLGCGKGAVSIKLAYELKCRCLGIDALEEFIDEANMRAIEHKVDDLCQFKLGDIRLKVSGLREFDIVILGSIGPVLGDHYHTLTSTKKCLKQNGLIIFDDGYIVDESTYTDPLVQNRSHILKQISTAGMELLDEMITGIDHTKKLNDFIFKNIKKRCHELIENRPDQKELFLNYIKQQEKENDVLENEVICSCMVIRNL